MKIKVCVTGPWAWQMVVFENACSDGTVLDDCVGCKELNLVHYCPNSLLRLVSGAWYPLNCLDIVQESSKWFKMLIISG